MIKTIIEWYRGLKKKIAITIVLFLLTIGGLLTGFINKFPAPLTVAISFLGLILIFVEIIIESFIISEEKLIKTTNNIVNIIEGTKYHDREPDVIKRIIEIKLGNEITGLIDFGDLPITLVPGGDIALIMTQNDYKTLLEKLLKRSWQQIKWTTFTPFEALNRLSIQLESDIAKWNSRNVNKKEYLSHNFAGNGGMYQFISNWFSSPAEKQQVIILSKETAHPLWSEKYLRYPFCIDFSKYLIARYAVINKENYARKKESEFINEIENALTKDEEDINNTNWLYIEDINNDILKNIHHLDFVLFKGNSRFVLVRVDPANYLKRDGGLVGITFLVYVEHNVELYENIFNKIKESSKESFISLVSKSKEEIKTMISSCLS